MNIAGVMVLARDIQGYSQTSDTEELYLTRIDGRGETSEQQFHSRQHHTLTPLGISI